MGIEEVIMFNVSEKASEMIKDFLKDKEENTNIRVFLSQGG
jgi:Fe-S cluster assembly iron-binding protein IscA